MVMGLGQEGLAPVMEALVPVVEALALVPEALVLVVEDLVLDLETLDLQAPRDGAITSPHHRGHGAPEQVGELVSGDNMMEKMLLR